MSKQPTIVVTGTAGFIGSVMVQLLNEKGLTDLLLVDDFGVEGKRKNWELKNYTKVIERQAFLEQLPLLDFTIDAIIHLGARTDTTEFDYAVHEELNVKYSKALWLYATEKQIPFIYASSAATYGSGEQGYDDSHTILDQLTPLNPYGVSKNEFDKWAIAQTSQPHVWTGLKFFNVYGPNENHKGRMASVVMHAYNQIKEKGSLKLFQSHNPNYQDGEQIRDFIYVKDLLELLWFWYKNPTKSGIYNAGTGKARTFNDLAKAIFAALETEPKIDYVPTPEDIRDKYQYFTEATMAKTESAGYSKPFSDLENAVADYVKNYLKTGLYY